MQVHVLLNPTLDKFGEAQKLLEPNLLYVQGELSGDGERIGSLVWGSGDLSEPQMFSSLIGPSLPTIVSLVFFVLFFSLTYALAVCFTVKFFVERKYKSLMHQLK